MTIHEAQEEILKELACKRDAFGKPRSIHQNGKVSTAGTVFIHIPLDLFELALQELSKEGLIGTDMPGAETYSQELWITDKGLATAQALHLTGPGSALEA